MTRIALFIGMFFCVVVNADGQADTASMASNRFFNDLLTQGEEVALKELYTSAPDVISDTAAMEEMVYQLQQLDSTYGSLKGYELIKRKKLGESFVLLTYMAKYEFEPVRYTLEFYRPDNHWVIYGFSFDLNLVRDLEDASRNF